MEVLLEFFLEDPPRQRATGRSGAAGLKSDRVPKRPGSRRIDGLVPFPGDFSCFEFRLHFKSGRPLALCKLEAGETIVGIEVFL